MTWVKLDDRFTENAKFEKAGPLAGWLYVAGLCFCAGNLTDGLIPKARAKILTPVPNVTKQIRALVDAGLWIDEGDHYRVHDYLDFQPSRRSVEADREKARRRMEKFRRSSGEQTPNEREKFADPDPSPTSRTPSVKPRLGSTTGGPGRKADSLVSVPDCTKCGDSGWVDHPVTGDAVRCTCELGATA